MILHNEDAKFIGGIVGDSLESLGNTIRDGIINGFLTIIEYLITFSYWFCQIGILVCILLFICSHDQKAVSIAFKLIFIFIIVVIIGGSL